MEPQQDNPTTQPVEPNRTTPSPSTESSIDNQVTNPAPSQATVNAQTQTTVEQPAHDNTAHHTQPAAQAHAKTNIFGFIIDILKKPYTAIREHYDDLNAPKNAAILGGIALVVAFISVLLSSIFSIVISSSKSSGIKIDFSNMEYFKLKDVVLTPVFYYAIAALCAIGVICVAAKILKANKISFVRLLSILSVAIIPLFVGQIITALLTKLGVWYVIPFLTSMIFPTYTACILGEAIISMTEDEKDKRAYLYLISAILISILLVIYIEVILDKSSSVMPGLNTFLPSGTGSSSFF